MTEFLLAIETSSTPSSVCIMKGETLMEQRFIREQKNTSSHLSKHVEELISKHLQSPQKINKVAVSVGPGSFSGLRAGVSFAKGMTFAINKSLHVVDTLFALYTTYKRTTNEKFDFYMPMIDARKDKAFVSVYNQAGEQVENNKLIHLSQHEWIEPFKGSKVFLPMHGNFSECLSKDDVNCIPIHLSSYNIGLAACQQSEAISNMSEIAYLEPKYIVNNYTK